jgi:hypothetical protein
VNLSAKDPSLRLHGPYLNEGVMLFAGKDRLNLERDLEHPLFWKADVTPLDTGRYTLRLLGDAETETSGEIPAALIVQP